MNHTHEATVLSSIVSWGSEAIDFMNHHWLTVSIFSGVVTMLLAVIGFQCCCRSKKQIVNIVREKSNSV
jgi:uncharacterized protein YacL